MFVIIFLVKHPHVQWNVLLLVGLIMNLPLMPFLVYPIVLHLIAILVLHKERIMIALYGRMY
jgi:hypothetical protein